jgi:enoyl-CoA hydratase/carnithine racemase
VAESEQCVLVTLAVELTQTLPGLVRSEVAKELTFTGRIVEAPEALELGLISRIAADPLAAAKELAAGRPPR